jgi:hypothetical protein
MLLLPVQTAYHKFELFPFFVIPFPPRNVERTSALEVSRLMPIPVAPIPPSCRESGTREDYIEYTQRFHIINTINTM